MKRPLHTGNKQLTWSSNSEKIATVKNGVIGGNKTGTVTITATAADGIGTHASITIMIIAGSKLISSAAKNEEAGEAVEAPSVSEPGNEVVQNSTLFLAVKLDSEKYQTDDERTAYVEKDGLVVSKRDGSASLRGVGGEFVITFKDRGVVKAVLFESSKLGLLMLDNDGKPMFVQWESDDPSVAAIDAAGILTAISNGSATATAMNEKGISVRIDIVVPPLPDTAQEPEEEAEPIVEPEPSSTPETDSVPQSDPEPTPLPTSEPSPEPAALTETPQAQENKPDEKPISLSRRPKLNKKGRYADIVKFASGSS